MDRIVLKQILDIINREDFFNSLLEFFESLNHLEHVTCVIHSIPDGKIPIIYVNKNNSINQAKYVKLFVGTQHNEYNGLFGILELFKQIKNDKYSISNMLIDKQVLIFAPLMNPYGFLHPRKDNKSGYFLKNGTNLNRFWRKTFIPGYQSTEKKVNDFPIPDEATLIKKILQPYWDKEDTNIYIIDFHETSLLERFPKELSMQLTNYYKFDHWLKELIIKNIIKLYGMKYYRNPLFYKCNSSSDHTHMNLSIKQVDFLKEKLFEYLSNNFGKLPFYFVHSRRSKDYCTHLGNNIYNKLKDILWETTFPVYDHKFHDHGCLVKMNDATNRDNLYCIELENQKQFFNIFEEIEKSKNDDNYFVNKLDLINKSLQLVKETIIEMISSF
ncbi:MAG: hypothetical protein ACFFAT_20810 [Promethearchaeota archaeon]